MVKEPAFIASDRFSGRKPGYKYQNGASGIGYYQDNYYPTDDDLRDGHHNGKRKREAFETVRDGGDGENGTFESVGAGGHADAEKDIERLLEDADAADIQQLDSISLKQLLLSFEKKITKNQKMRMKHPDEPQKFMESELELHSEIQELFVVAASPELYPVLVHAGAVTSILGMVTHENTDISLSAVSLLQEMTDVEAVTEEAVAVAGFIDALVAAQGLELLVQNLSRLDEASSDEDAQGVSNTMAIIENLVDLKPEIAVAICQKTHILKYLLGRLKAKQFDANKLSCSEILSILLQADDGNQKLLCELEDVDGMDELLQCIAVYRKKEVTHIDEQECVENIFLCLNAALQQRENQQKFLDCEGFELLMRCLKEQQYSAGCTIHTISYAIMNHKACCEGFVDVGGMKYVFPMLTGGGMKRVLKRKGSGEKRNFEESAVSIVAQICTLLGASQVKDYSARILHKLTEKEHEKLERCVELFSKYQEALQRTDEEIEQTRHALEISAERGGAAEKAELQEFLDDEEEVVYAQRLEGGLFNVQQLAIIMTFACIYDMSGKSTAKVALRLDDAEVGLNLSYLLEVMRGIVLTLEGSDDSSSSSSSSSSNNSYNREDGEEDAEREFNNKQKLQFTQWCAALARAIDERGSNNDITTTSTSSRSSSSSSSSN